MPVSDAARVPAEVGMLKEPFEVPDAVGTKAMATVHPVPAPSVVPQVLAVILKLADTVGTCNVAERPPVFEMAMFWAPLVEPIRSFPKSRDAGVRTIAAGVAPDPIRDAVDWPPGVFETTVSVPDAEPETVGENFTCIVQLALFARETRVQFSVSMNAPVIETLLTTSVPPPEFVMVIV